MLMIGTDSHKLAHKGLARLQGAKQFGLNFANWGLAYKIIDRV